MPAMLKRSFAVLLAVGETTRLVRLEAEGRGLAVAAAEASPGGGRAVSVVEHSDVLGRCGRCGAVVFADDSRVSGAGYRCSDC
jgi:predicted RNA-binding Zn-ribbon protein involved in translation (DUF1610 family)